MNRRCYKMSKRKVTSYSLEFKQSSAKLAAESDRAISTTARELGVHEATLHGWVKRYAPVKGKSNFSQTTTCEELKRVKKELARVKQERDILKKAAAYFASEMQ